MAASVAAQLSKENDLEVETAKGGLGEFSVLIDGQRLRVAPESLRWRPRIFLRGLESLPISFGN